MGGWLSSLLCLHQVQVGGSSYRVVRRVGEGAFSFVDLVTDRAGRQLALKRIEIAYSEQEHAVLHEISVYQRLSHPNILTLLNHDFLKRSNSTQEARLVFPFYARGTIQDWIEGSIRDPLHKKQLFIIRLSITICDGLQYMHSLTPPLAHRDLKPANILISDDSTHAVLMDLGSVQGSEVRISNRQQAMVLQERAAQESTATYRAPELFDCPAPGLISARTDVWSLGCTLFAMAYGDSPFDGTVMSTLSGRVPIPTAQGGAQCQGFVEVLKWILIIDPNTRPDLLAVRARLQGMNDS